jgi:hypothetical protein
MQALGESLQACLYHYVSRLPAGSLSTTQQLYPGAKAKACLHACIDVCLPGFPLQLSHLSAQREETPDDEVLCVVDVFEVGNDAARGH